MKLSLCMIVKDEGDVLGGFLENIKDSVDDIVIVDTGSSDSTWKIASCFGRVYGYKWKDDFADVRNFSISKAEGDWILVLDPDELVRKEDIVKMRDLASSAEDDIFGFRIIQDSFSRGKKIGARGICRLFRNDDRIRFIYPVHESVRESIKKLGKRIAKSGIVIKHCPKLAKEKSDYYQKLIRIKRQKFPESNWKKELENEWNLLLNL